MNKKSLASEIIDMTSHIKLNDYQLFRPMSIGLFAAGIILLCSSVFLPAIMGKDMQKDPYLFAKFDIMHCVLGSMVIILLGVMFKLCYVIGCIKDSAVKELRDLS